MSLFAKKKEAGTPFLLPAYVFASLVFLALSLIFLLCYNEPTNGPYGEGDALSYTLPFFLTMLMGSFLSFLFYLALPKDKTWAMALSFLPLALEFVGLILGINAYFGHYGETDTRVAFPRYVIALLLFALLALSLFSRLQEGFLKGKFSKYLSKTPSFLNHLSLALGSIVALLSVLSVNLTTGLSGNNPANVLFLVAFVLVLLALVCFLILFFLPRFEEKRLRYQTYLSYLWIALGAVFALTYAISFAVMSPGEGGLTFRAFMWGLSEGILLALFGLLSFLSLRLEEKGETFKKLLEEALSEEA